MFRLPKRMFLIGTLIFLFLAGCKNNHSWWQVKTDSMAYPATFSVPSDGSIAEVQRKVRVLLQKNPQHQDSQETA